MSRWQWRIEPLVPVLHGEAAARSVHEAFIALPAECRGAPPRVTDATGAAVRFAWKWLGDGAGWHIRIPAGEPGPWIVTCCAVPEVLPAEFDETAIGLELTVIEDWKRELPAGSERWFEDIFRTVPNQKSLRVERIDQVENPAGNNDYFLARYRGPLLVPEDGQYALGINSDDGSFLKIDGQVTLSWLGNHFPDAVEIGSRYNFLPLVNAWTHNATVSLQKGVHWIEFYHQEMSGTQMAHMGWRRPALAGDAGPLDYFFRGFSPDANGWEVVPAQFLDGQIPCAVEVLCDGKVLGTVMPTAGLRLRRPSKAIFTARVKTAGATGCRDLFFEAPGPAEIGTPDGRPLPIWICDGHMRPLALEHEQRETVDGRQVLRTLLYDVELPLELKVGERRLGAKMHGQRKWHAWDLEPCDAGKPFELALSGISLVRGMIEEWPFECGKEARMLAAGRVGRLVQPLTTGQVLAIPASACRDWYSGDAGAETVTPAPLRFDLWSGRAGEMVELVAGRAGGRTGVLLVLDDMPAIRGLSPRDVRLRIGAHVCALLHAGVMPVLALGPDLDFGSLFARQYAETFVRLAESYKCPCLDLRSER